MESNKRASRITNYFIATKRLRTLHSSNQSGDEDNNTEQVLINNIETCAREPIVLDNRKNSSIDKLTIADNESNIDIDDHSSLSEETDSDCLSNSDSDSYHESNTSVEILNVQDASINTTNTNDQVVTDPLINHETKYRFSIYKLKNRRLANLNKVQNDFEKFQNLILDELKKNALLKGPIDSCEPFHLKHFYYSTKQKTNVTAFKISKRKYPGDTKTGNILVFFRLKTVDTSKVTPEAYFLCDGHGFHAILHLSDSKFRTQVAKHFMDGDQIKELETINIAGPDILTKITYKENTSIATQTAAYLERAISKVCGVIKPNSQLHKLLQDKVNEGIGITVGMNFVKIDKPLKLETFSKVLELLSMVIDTDVDRSTCHILNALEYVSRVEDDEKRKKLNKNILQKAIEVVCENKNTEDYYLSHRYIRDWLLSSEVELKEVNKKDKDENIFSWNSAPTLKKLIDAIHKHLPAECTRRKLLQGKNIVLSYRRPGKVETHPVQEYIHGMVKGEDDGAFFKIGQKWFFLSSTFSEIVDRNFAFLSSRLLDDNRILDLIKYPWNTSKYKISIADASSFLGLSGKEAKEILDELTKEISLVDDSNKCVLTKASCLLPKSSKLYNDMEKMTDKRKNKTSCPLRLTVLNTEQRAEGGGQDINDEPNCKQDMEDTKSVKVQTALYNYIASKSTVTEENILNVLKKKRPILKMNDGKYFVENPVLTIPLIDRLKSSVPSLNESKLLQFLKFMSVLSEGEYNELFLFCEQNDKFIIFPGDRIFANNVELFDILIYDQEKHTTYLLHNKDGLNHITRDVCAQIRNSSELIWYDFLRGQRNHLELFWEAAVNSKTANSVYRQFLREKLTSLGEAKFKDMFNETAKLVYVLGFTQRQAIEKPTLKFKFKPIDRNDIQVDDGIMKSLHEEGYLSASGFLTDLFLGMTQEMFVNKLTVKGLTNKRKKKIYSHLREYGTCNLSTIAKLELLTLDGCFGRYQIGGEKCFKLALLQLPLTV